MYSELSVVRSVQKDGLNANQIWASLDPQSPDRMYLGLEARGGIEPPIKVLQTFALPLGDRAFVLQNKTKLQKFLKRPDCFYCAPAAEAVSTVGFAIGAPIRLPHSVHEPS